MTERRKFSALLAVLHRDAVACALADFDRGVDGREPAQRDGALALALECVGAQELGNGVTLTPEARPAAEYWLRCYDAMTGTVREPPAPFVEGQRIVVTTGVHRGRCGTVRTADAGTGVDLDPVEGHTGTLYKRWTRAADHAEWVLQ